MLLDILIQLYLCVSGIPQGYPRIVENPRLKAVQKDHPAILACRATVEGRPNGPDIYWLKDYRPVDINDPRIQMSDDGKLYTLILIWG